MKIDFAAGKHRVPGYFSIDAVEHPKAAKPLDMIHALEFESGNLVNPVPLPDGCAEELQSFHFLEHVARYEADSLVAEWHRLLKSGGSLVLELPNIELAAKNLLAGMGDQFSMWPLYGDWSHKNPYMLHKHGYTPKTLKGLLKAGGFEQISILPPRTHGAKLNRDMRAEAVKP